MKYTQIIDQKVHTLDSLLKAIASWRAPGKTVAFTNGVYDLLHVGHLQSLMEAAAEADYLVVAVNSDASVKRLKGEKRPVVAEADRAQMIAANILVDAVIIFDEDTPENVVNAVRPDVLVKGGDYTVEQIVGAPFVMSYGGRVVINGIREGYSTTGLLERLAGEAR